MALISVQHGGRIIRFNNEPFFSPNSLRDVSLPPALPQSPNINHVNFMSPQWLTPQFAFLAFIPLRPRWTHVFRSLYDIPPITKRKDQQYMISESARNSWQRIEDASVTIMSTLGGEKGGIGYEVPGFVRPSLMGFNQPHPSKEIARHQVSLARDYFSALVGALSYLIHRKQKNKKISRRLSTGICFLFNPSLTRSLDSYPYSSPSESCPCP